MSKQRITCMYDDRNQTWNAMLGRVCLFYGTIFELEHWLVENDDLYYD